MFEKVVISSIDPPDLLYIILVTAIVAKFYEERSFRVKVGMGILMIDLIKIYELY